MKIRTGFVSNSSTSSFICNICGEIESGYDMSLSDVDMKCCVRGHCWHNDCFDTDESKIDDEFILNEFREWAKENHHQYLEEYCEKINGVATFEELKELDFYEELYDEMFSDYDYPEGLCPFCKLEMVSESDAFKYLMKKHGYEDLKYIATCISQDFESYKEFATYLKR